MAKGHAHRVESLQTRSIDCPESGEVSKTFLLARPMAFGGGGRAGGRPGGRHVGGGCVGGPVAARGRLAACVASRQQGRGRSSAGRRRARVIKRPIGKSLGERHPATRPVAHPRRRPQGGGGGKGGAGGGRGHDARSSSHWCPPAHPVARPGGSPPLLSPQAPCADGIAHRIERRAPMESIEKTNTRLEAASARNSHAPPPGRVRATQRYAFFASNSVSRRPPEDEGVRVPCVAWWAGRRRPPPCCVSLAAATSRSAALPPPVAVATCAIDDGTTIGRCTVGAASGYAESPPRATRSLGGGAAVDTDVRAGGVGVGAIVGTTPRLARARR